jgi:hypothetical protein
MNDYDRQHTPSRCVFFVRYLSKQVKQASGAAFTWRLDKHLHSGNQSEVVL